MRAPLIPRMINVFVAATGSTETPDLITHGEYYGDDTGGKPFNDEASWQRRQITGIATECTDKFIIGIQIKYGDNWAPKHGGITHCKCETRSFWCKPEDNHHVMNIALDSDERVTGFNMTMGTAGHTMPHIYYVVHFATISTNKRVLSTCGEQSTVGNETSVFLKGNRLEYISGRAGCAIDGLRLHWSGP